jgi:acid stress-induced BolA-like protein IbaG/YrbA
LLKLGKGRLTSTGRGRAAKAARSGVISTTLEYLARPEPPSPDQQGVRTVETESVAQLIRSGLPGAEVHVTGDGSHFDAVVISSEFGDKSPIQKQRMVMDTVRPQIESGELHALSIKTFTPEQWSGQGG